MTYTYNEEILQQLLGSDAGSISKDDWVVIVNKKVALVLVQLAEGLYFVVKTRCNIGVCADGAGKIINMDEILRYLKTGFFD